MTEIDRLVLTDEHMEIMKTELRPPHINTLLDEIREHGCVEIEIDPVSQD